MIIQLHGLLLMEQALTININGLLTAVSDGTLTVTATANDSLRI